MSAIAGVAMPQQSRLHFTAKDAWWSGTGGAPSQTGWLGVGLISARRRTVSTIRCEPSRSVAEVRHLSACRRRPPLSATRPPSPRDGSRRGRRWPCGGLLATASAPNAEPTLAAAQQAIPGTLDAVALLAAAAGSDSLSAYENPTPGAGRRRSTCCRLPRTSLRCELAPVSSPSGPRLRHPR